MRLLERHVQMAAGALERGCPALIHRFFSGFLSRDKNEVYGVSYSLMSGDIAPKGGSVSQGNEHWASSYWRSSPEIVLCIKTNTSSTSPRLTRTFLRGRLMLSLAFHKGPRWLTFRM
jgi:hypothetical protein